MRTLAQMRNAIAENLLVEGVDTPNPERLTQLVNRAKNHVVALRDRFDRYWFLERKDYSVSRTDASITLPDGSGEDAAFRRLITVEWVERKVAVAVYEHGALQEKDYGEAGFYLTREGRSLYFSARTGAPSDMTLRAHYAGLVADLGTDDDAEGFDRLEHDWCDLVEAYATVLGVPARNEEATAKWQAVYAALRDNLTILATAALSAPVQIGLDPNRP